MSEFSWSLDASGRRSLRSPRNALCQRWLSEGTAWHVAQKPLKWSFDARASPHDWQQGCWGLGSSTGQRSEPEGAAETVLLSTCCTLTLAQAVVELGRLQELLPPALPLSPPQVVLHTWKTPPDSSNVSPMVKHMSDPCQGSRLYCSCNPAPLHCRAGAPSRRQPAPSSTQHFLVQRGLTFRKASKLITFMVAAFFI